MSPKKEPVEIDEDLEAESRELLESSDTFEDESELCEQSLYVGHQMDETNNTASENTENVEVKDEKVDISDLTMPGTWTVKHGKGKTGSGKFLYTSPDGRFFWTVQTAIEYMLEKDYPKEHVEIMKTNLRYEGWKEADYLPNGWLLSYYKASNGFLYLSPDCKLFKSAKAVTDFMKKNNYNPNIIEDVKREMQESKKFNSKMKFKWQKGDSSLPKGWKLRKAKGTGRIKTEVEFILSDDGIQFKSRFEALHYIINNNYSENKIKELRQKLVSSSEKWKTSELLPSGWIYKFKGEDPTGTQITYFSVEGKVYHSMKNVMEFMKTNGKYNDVDIENCKDFLKTVVKYAERKYDWTEGNETVPRNWRVRKGEGESEQILSPDGIAYR